MQMQIFINTNKGIRFKNDIEQYYNKYFILHIVYALQIVTRLNFSWIRNLPTRLRLSDHS